MVPLEMYNWGTLGEVLLRKTKTPSTYHHQGVNFLSQKSVPQSLLSEIASQDRR